MLFRSRQALTILAQDGYIYKHQGKGTFVSFRGKDITTNIYNYLVEDALEPITDIQMHYNLGLPTRIAKEKLGLAEKEQVLASNNIYFSDEIPIGQSFIQIPISMLKENHITVQSKEELLQFIKKDIYSLAKEAQVSIQLVQADEQVTPFLQLPEGTVLLYCEQLLFNKEKTAIARIKYYFVEGKYQIHFKL